MFCPNCGKEIGEEDVFCVYCGYRVQEESTPKTAPVTTESKAYCQHCGKEIAEEDEFCCYCGGRQNVTPTQSAQSTPSAQSVQSEKASELNVPVMQNPAYNGQSVTVCRMCGCTIPSDSVYCPVCSQRTGYTPSAPQTYYDNSPYAASNQPARNSERKKPGNTLALVGFILALVSAFFLLTSDNTLFIMAAIPGLILGINGLKKVKETGKGKAFALTAIIVSAIVLFVLLILTIIGIVNGASAGGTTGDEFYYFYFGDYFGY